MGESNDRSILQEVARPASAFLGRTAYCQYRDERRLYG
jgi:hypothetical protein